MFQSALFVLISLLEIVVGQWQDGREFVVPLSKFLLAIQCLHTVILRYIISEFETTSLNKHH